MDIFTYSTTTLSLLQPRHLTLIIVKLSVFCLYSKYPIRPGNVLYTVFLPPPPCPNPLHSGFNQGTCLAFACHASLVSFNLEKPLLPFIFHNIDRFEEYKQCLFGFLENDQWSGFVWLCFLLDSGYNIMVRLCSFHFITPKGTCVVCSVFGNALFDKYVMVGFQNFLIYW